MEFRVAKHKKNTETKTGEEGVPVQRIIYSMWVLFEYRDAFGR